jgi:hypothetical protein
MTRYASCSCGKLQIVCEGEPVRVGICHCLACQRRTGSIFGVQARFARDKVSVQGVARAYVRIGDDGGRLVFRFCPECGATVYYVMDEEPDLVGVPVGAFADPSFPAPQYAVYVSRRHPWAGMPDLHLERLEP